MLNDAVRCALLDRINEFRSTAERCKESAAARQEMVDDATAEYRQAERITKDLEAALTSLEALEAGGVKVDAEKGVLTIGFGHGEYQIGLKPRSIRPEGIHHVGGFTYEGAKFAAGGIPVKEWVHPSVKVEAYPGAGLPGSSGSTKIPLDTAQAEGTAADGVELKPGDRILFTGQTNSMGVDADDFEEGFERVEARLRYLHDVVEEMRPKRDEYTRTAITEAIGIAMSRRELESTAADILIDLVDAAFGQT